MQTISSIEKLRLLKDDVYDLRNVDLKQLEDITSIIDMAKGEKAGTNITMSTRDMVKLILNTHKNLLLDEQNRNYLIDEETLCKVILEIDDFKDKLADIAWDKVIVKAEEAENQDMTPEQRIDALRCKITVLEETIHTLKLNKTVILPTDNMYRSKREYDSLREHLSEAVAEQQKMSKELCNAEEIIEKQQQEIDKLKKELEETGERL